MEQKSPPKEREVDFERPRALILPLSRDDRQSRAAEQEIAVSLPGNQYFRKWRKPGSDRARILKCYHVILNNQTPLTTHIADLFACDWYFPRNRLPLVSSVKTAMEQKSPPKEREVDFERPRALILPLSRDDIQSRAAEQENRGLVARQLILPEMT